MIVVGNETGLGARIKNIVSAFRKSHLVNDEVFIHHFDYNYIFDIEQIATRKVEQTDWYLTYKLDDPVVDTRLLYDDSKEIIIINQLTPPTVCGGIDFQYDNITHETRQKWLTYFNLIKWAPHIQAEVHRLYYNMQLQDAVGVHLRSWYEDKIKKAVCGIYDVKLFAETIESLGCKKILLCADHVDAEEELRAVLSKDIEIMTRNSHGREERHIEFDNKHDILVYAGIDLLLLSKCKTIVGSYQSTFTEVAWWLSQCESKVIIPIPQCVKDAEIEYRNSQKILTIPKL